MIFGKGKESISASVVFVQNYWASFSSCHDTSLLKGDGRGKGRADEGMNLYVVEKKPLTWQPPAPEFIKINVDASFVESISSASVGIIARNHMGETLISSWDYIGLCNSVDEAELKACLAGIYIGISLHKPIILETDSSFVASFLGNETFDRSSLIDLKKKALSAAKLIENFKISNIKREANAAAHELAKFSFDNRFDGFLLNSVLPCVANIVLNDCMNLAV